MAYLQEMRDRAFQLWCIDQTFESVVAQMAKEFPQAKGISRKTLARWRDEDGWDARRGGVREQYMAAQDQDLGARLAAIDSKLQAVVEKIFVTLMDSSPERWGEAAYSLPAILGQLRKFAGADNVEMNPAQFRRVLARVLKGLRTVPALARVLNEEVTGQAVAAVEAEFGKRD